MPLKSRLFLDFIKGRVWCYKGGIVRFCRRPPRGWAFTFYIQNKTRTVSIDKIFSMQISENIGYKGFFDIYMLTWIPSKYSHYKLFIEI